MYRIPHQVLPLCPPIPSLWQHVRDPELLDHPVMREILGTPLHLLITDRRDRRTSKAIRTHLIESTLPPGAIVETALNIQACSPLFTLLTLARHLSTIERTSKAIRTHLIESTLPPGAIVETALNIQACSPLFTLLTLARHLSTIELAMAMYEFCGNFSVFKPSPGIEELLQTPESIALAKSPQGWRRVTSSARTSSGGQSSLWMRPPLISLDIEELLQTPESIALAKSPQGWRRVTSSARTSSGGQSSLWMRPPLISLDELNRFARQCAPIRGCRRFAQAARLVTGVNARPFADAGDSPRRRAS